MIIDPKSPNVVGVNPADERPRASLLSALVAWAAIIFVCPVAIVAFYLLLPNIGELLDRLFVYQTASRRPLTIMILMQVALLTLPAMTFLSWRRGRRSSGRPHSNSRTIGFGCATIAVGLFAYWWIAMMVAAFPD